MLSLRFLSVLMLSATFSSSVFASSIQEDLLEQKTRVAQGSEETIQSTLDQGTQSNKNASKKRKEDNKESKKPSKKPRLAQPLSIEEGVPSLTLENTTNISAAPQDVKQEKICFNIGNITPVKNTMTSKEEAKKAIQLFFQQEVLKPENELKESDIAAVQNVSTNGTGRIFTLITMADETQWVQGFGGIERFLGALYLKKAIEFHGLGNEWKVAETKFVLKKPIEEGITVTVKSSQKSPLKNIFTVDSRDFIPLSRYAGEEKPGTQSCSHIRNLSPKCGKLTTSTGFSDMLAFANFRVQEGDEKITVIDTEYRSFCSDTIVTPPSDEVEKEIGNFTFTFSEVSGLS